VARVVTTGVLPTRRGLRVFRAVLRDESGLLECAWPGQPFLERQIKKGQLLLVIGPVRYYHGRQLVPREFVVLADEEGGRNATETNGGGGGGGGGVVDQGGGFDGVCEWVCRG